jgi:hypothetical protein
MLNSLHSQSRSLHTVKDSADASFSEGASIKTSSSGEDFIKGMTNDEADEGLVGLQTISPERATPLLKAARSKLFLHRVMTLKNQQDAIDMVSAALLHGTWKQHHLEFLLQAAKPAGFSSQREIVSGESLLALEAHLKKGGLQNVAEGEEAGATAEGLLLSAAEVHRAYDVDSVVVRPWERAVALFEVIYETVKAQEKFGGELSGVDSSITVVEGIPSPSSRQGALSVGEAEHNRLLSYLLAHVDVARPSEQENAEGGAAGGIPSEPEPLSEERRTRLLAIANGCWALCSRMELRGFNVTNAKSLEVLGLLVEAFDGKQLNPANSSATLYTSRREWLDEQTRKLQFSILKGSAVQGGELKRGGRPAPRPRVEPNRSGL